MNPVQVAYWAPYTTLDASLFVFLEGEKIPFLRTMSVPSLATWPYTTWVCTPPPSTPAVTRSPPFWVVEYAPLATGVVVSSSGPLLASRPSTQQESQLSVCAHVP